MCYIHSSLQKEASSPGPSRILVARCSTYVKPKQYIALLRENPTVKMDISIAGKAPIRFGKGSVAASIGTLRVSNSSNSSSDSIHQRSSTFGSCLYIRYNLPRGIGDALGAKVEADLA